MKKIEAIVKPFKFEEVRDALALVGVERMVVTEVHGSSSQYGHAEQHGDYMVNFPPRVKLEMVVINSLAEKVVGAIIKAAKTGKIGDGKIFIYPMMDAVRIRTEEKGEQAV